MRFAKVHWGGGTPTFYDTAHLAGLTDGLRGNFRFDAEAEISIEVDPRGLAGLLNLRIPRRAAPPHTAGRLHALPAPLPFRQGSSTSRPRPLPGVPGNRDQETHNRQDRL